MSKKRIISLILAAATLISFIIVINTVNRKKNEDPYLHVCDLQDVKDPEGYLGKEACILVKSNFYAGYAPGIYGGYAYYPLYDCSEKNPGYVIAGYEVEDQEISNEILKISRALRLESIDGNNDDIKERPGYFIKGTLFPFSYFADPGKYLFQDIMNYKEDALSLQGVYELSGTEYLSKEPALVLDITGFGPVENEHGHKPAALLFIIPFFLFLSAAFFFVAAVNEEKYR